MMHANYSSQFSQNIHIMQWLKGSLSRQKVRKRARSLARIRHRPPEPRILGSNPSGPAIFDSNSSCSSSPFFFSRQPTPDRLSPDWVHSEFSSNQVFYCMDCVSWCGRCSEPTMKGKKSVNRIASSEACSAFKLRGQTTQHKEGFFGSGS